MRARLFARRAGPERKADSQVYQRLGGRFNPPAAILPAGAAAVTTGPGEGGTQGRCRGAPAEDQREASLLPMPQNLQLVCPLKF